MLCSPRYAAQHFGNLSSSLAPLTRSFLPLTHSFLSPHRLNHNSLSPTASYTRAHTHDSQMTQPIGEPPNPELEEELDNFRREWLEEQKRKATVPVTIAPRSPPATVPVELNQHHSPPRAPVATASTSPPRRKHVRRDSADQTMGIEDRLEGMVLEEKWKPKQPQTALELYEVAVISEREGRLNDGEFSSSHEHRCFTNFIEACPLTLLPFAALLSYRQAFRLDPDVDKAFHRTFIAPHASRGAEPHGSAPSVTSAVPADPHAFQFQRTLQMHKDYTPEEEHRSVAAVEEGMGEGTAHEDTTHPSSTAYLFASLMRSIAANPYERPAPAFDAPASSTSPPSAPSPLITKVEARSSTTTPEQALADLTFIPADPKQPIPLLVLPREILTLILRFLALSSVTPPPRPKPSQTEDAPLKRRGPRRKTLKEEMAFLETDLELEDVDRPWKMDVEALERFARTCRAGRILTLDTSIWRALCTRTYVPPHQISREESAHQIVKSHGNDWRRCFIEQ